MQQKDGKLISAAQYAKLRGLNRSTISRQIAHGAIPTHDGLLDPKEADQAREKNLNGIRRDQAARRKAERAATKPAPVVEYRPAAPFVSSDGRTVQPSTNPDVWAAVADTLRRAAAPEEVLTFARVALRMGCTALQSYALATWFACQPCLIDFENLDADELNTFEEPSEEQWFNLLGPDFDLAEAEDFHDRMTIPETSPPTA